MTKNLVPLKALFQKNFPRSRPPFIIIALILFIIVIGSLYFRNTEPHTPLAALPSSQVISTASPEEVTALDGEDENDDEEDAQDPDGAWGSLKWSLLKTALPSPYFEPGVQTKTPSITLILTGLGLNKEQTDRVLVAFKGKVTFAFSPYSSDLQDQLQKAVQSGNSVLAMLPLEPYDFPNPDPGPLTLLTGVKAEENILKVKPLLKKLPNGVGIIGDYGSRFTISQIDLEPVLKEIKNHGRTFIDPYATFHSQVQETCKILGMTCPRVDLSLTSGSKIDLTDMTERNSFFKKVIQSAEENGTIIVSMPLIPTVTNHLLEWISASEKKGVKFVTIDHSSPPELLPTVSRNDQSAENDNR